MKRDDHRELLAVAARAFWHDPLLDFFARDLLHEYKVLPAGFDAYLKDAAGPQGEVWVSDHQGRPRAVAAWLRPGSYPRPALREALWTARFATVIARSRRRGKAIRLFREVERHHPHEPHWYLALLATDPTVQGRGIGSNLLAPVLERCDHDGVFAYAETQKEANVAWYARSGFDVVHEVRLAETPPVWCIRREPRLP